MSEVETMKSDVIVGIDLGTTNSEVALFRNGKVEVVSFDGETIMPSVVSLGDDNVLLVGTPAFNQGLLFPEHTASSIKRLMGFDEPISLGTKKFQPQEISAMILRELKSRAESYMGQKVDKAVITVPAYFSDAQRQATHDAGVIAGFKVERILNEPTAASLAYAAEPGKSRLVLVYDLGGGTFDVSIVETQDGVTEVLASHGNPRLGGDDFDCLLLNEIIENFVRQGNPDPRLDKVAMCRLTRAAVEAKHELSHAPYVQIREENLLERDGIPIHCTMEISRERYESLVRPLIDKTFESVSQALRDSGRKASDLDAVLPVGGMTRTPLILYRLEEVLGKTPRQDVHPDLAVAYGAGILASRLSGHYEGQILVDITPYSFGPAVVSEGPFGFPIPDVFSPIIRKGTPLPAKGTEIYATICDNQKAWSVKIYQGEQPTVHGNIKIGDFIADGFASCPAGNPILCTLELDINGILHVTVLEKATGLTKRVHIENALGTMALDDLKKARANLDEFFGKPRVGLEEAVLADLGDQGLGFAKSQDSEESPIEPAGIIDVAAGKADDLRAKARVLLTRAFALSPTADEGDREDLEKRSKEVEKCLKNDSDQVLAEAMAELDDLLYFIEED